MNVWRCCFLVAISALWQLPSSAHACTLSRQVANASVKCIAVGTLPNGFTCTDEFRAKSRENIDWVLFRDKRAFETYKTALDELTRSCGMSATSLQTIFDAIMVAQEHNHRAQCHLSACRSEETLVGVGYLWKLADDKKLPYPPL